MRKKSFNLFVIISSFAVFSLGVYVYACGFHEEFGYDYNSMFTPEATVDGSYSSMFYAPNDFLYYGGELNSGSYRFNNDIVADWTNYIGKKESREAIAYYLLNDTAAQYIPAIINLKVKSKAPFNLNYQNERTRDFVDFLQLAKKIERYSTSPYSWDYETAVKVTDAIVTETQSFYDEVKNKDSFYKNRIWFQLMKAHFYSTDVSSTMAFFEETQNEQPKNILYYRALAYVAGAYYQQQNFDKSNVLFADVFDKAPPLRDVAVYNFRPTDEATFKNQIEQAKSKEVQAAMWAIYGYYTDEFRAMQEIYKIDSKSEHINFLLTRWVNIQENNINVYQDKALTSTKTYHNEVKKAINQKQFKWVKQVASKPEKIENPELWNLTVGYFNIFEGHFKQAEKAFNLATRSVKADNQLLKDQIRLFQLINQVSQVKKIDAKVENALLNDLGWFFKFANSDNYSSGLRSEYAINWIRKYLSAVYLNQKNTVMSELLWSQKAYILKDENFDQVQQVFFKENKTPMETLLVNNYKFDVNQIYEYQAIRLYLSGEIDQAIAVYKKIKPIATRQFNYDSRKYDVSLTDDVTRELFGNPFNGRISDCSDCDHQAKQSVKYTALSMLQKMKEMKANVDSGNDVYNNALLIGNAYYNTSYFGNARSFFYNPIINDNLFSSNLDIDDFNSTIILDFNQAKKYYETALNAATNDEQRAKATFMLAKIDRNIFFRNYYFWNSNKKVDAGYFDREFLNWNSFKSLKQNYSKTKYYQEVIHECGYFRDYLFFHR